MADNDNTITLVGRIGQEPELRATSKGDVLNFNIATNERKQAADGSWSDGATSWIRVAAWNDLGRNAHASFHRGQRVIVRGVLSVHEFPVEGGGRSKSVEVRATALGHDLRWGTSGFSDGARPGATRAAPSVPAQERVEPAQAALVLAPAAAGSPGDWGAPSGGPEAQRETVPSSRTAGDWAAEDETPF